MATQPIVYRPDAGRGPPGYEFRLGYPTPDTVRRGYDDLDLIRAAQMYRIFYPTVSGAALYKGLLTAGVIPNRRFALVSAQPRHVSFTLNSDTPYGTVLLDLSDGPMVVDLPPGLLIGTAIDLHQRWLADLGLPGPDDGKGGSHLFLPPGHPDVTSDEYYVARSSTNRVIVGMRSLPTDANVDGAFARMTTVRARPPHVDPMGARSEWFDLSDTATDTTPLAYEGGFQYWSKLHEILEAEPAFEGYCEHYGELAALGIEKGSPFEPDERLRRILDRAARLACAQMRVEAFADRRPDRLVWPDRYWEWACLRFENGAFDTAGYTDTYARDKWFYQAVATSPAMFRRDAGPGSLYWLGLRDEQGYYLDGGRSYRLTVPQPVPQKLWWSVTVYDIDTRSQIVTDQGRAALRSFFELKDAGREESVDLYFGPDPQGAEEARWIRTIPGRGWFAYFRIYGPEKAAFDGTWKPNDFKEISGRGRWL